MAESASAAKPPDSALSDEQLGTIAVRLALYPQRWVERRVEGLTFIDDTTIRQRVSITMRHPAPSFFPDGAQPTNGQRLFCSFDVAVEGDAS